MKKRLGLIFALFMILQLLTVGVAGAAYNAENDITLSIQTGTGDIITLPLTDDQAQQMFEAQENIHQKIQELTGLGVDHWYIWIEVDGVKVLAVDPPVAMY
jgi:CHASE3 domain sensor protein